MSSYRKKHRLKTAHKYHQKRFLSVNFSDTQLGVKVKFSYLKSGVLLDCVFVLRRHLLNGWQTVFVAQGGWSSFSDESLNGQNYQVSFITVHNFE